MIDTAQKRRCISGISLYANGPGVTMDATPGIEWRQEVGYGYSGIPAGSPVIPPAGGGGNSHFTRITYVYDEPRRELEREAELIFDDDEALLLALI